MQSGREREVEVGTEEGGGKRGWDGEGRRGMNSGAARRASEVGSGPGREKSVAMGFQPVCNIFHGRRVYFATHVLQHIC